MISQQADWKRICREGCEHKLEEPREGAALSAEPANEQASDCLTAAHKVAHTGNPTSSVQNLQEETTTATLPAGRKNHPTIHPHLHRHQ